MKTLEILRLWLKQQKNFLPELKAQANRYSKINDAHGLPDRVLSESKAVFILSTGRAGTQFITELIDGTLGWDVVHEPQPELLYTSRWAYENQNSLPEIKAAFLAARYEILRNSYLKNYRYLETNNRISFLAPAIAEILPNAKFIHLVRKPESFVKSGMLRNWFTNEHLTDEGRIFPKSDGPKTQEEKIGWLWNETNRFIHEFGKTMSSERFLTLRSEDLFQKNESVKSLFSFLDLAYPGDDHITKLRNKPVNQSKKKSSTVSLEGSWKTWTPLASKFNY
jgi:hypothetical protein